MNVDDLVVVQFELNGDLRWSELLACLLGALDIGSPGVGLHGHARNPGRGDTPKVAGTRAIAVTFEANGAGAHTGLDG